MVHSRKQAPYKLSGDEGSPPGSEEVQATLPGKNFPCCVRQHHGSVIHEQGGGYEIRFSLCPPVASPFLVQQPRHPPVSPTHTGLSERDYRQVVKAQASDPDRMVSPPGDIRSDLSQVAQTPNRPVLNQIQQVILVCLSGSGSEGVGHRCPQPLMGSSGPVCFPPSSPSGQGDQQTATSKLSQDDSDGPGVAQHALVLGPSHAVLPDTSATPTMGDPIGSTVQWECTQGSTEPKSTCLAPQAESIWEQGFSSQVAERIEAPQISSTRSVYEAKWSLFVHWCNDNKVDFRSPTIKQIADFLLHLLQEKKL